MLKGLEEEGKKAEEMAEEQKKAEETEAKRVGLEKMREGLRDVGMQPAGFVVENGVVGGSVFLVVGEIVEAEDGSKELFVDLENNEAM